MDKSKWSLVFFLVVTAGLIFLGRKEDVPVPVAPVPPIVEPPPPTPPVEPDVAGLQVPIAKKDRVFNKSGSQCVWCSIESLGRHHGVKELYEGNTRLTLNYTFATSPRYVAGALGTKYPTVKWKQIQNRSQVKAFLKKYVAEKKFGAGLGVPGHMLNLIHYDEAAGNVKIIDNAGSKALQVQTWTMDKLDRVMDGWVLTVFPPNYIETSFEFDRVLRDPDALHGFKRD